MLVAESLAIDDCKKFGKWTRVMYSEISAYIRHSLRSGPHHVDY